MRMRGNSRVGCRVSAHALRLIRAQCLGDAPASGWWRPRAPDALPAPALRSRAANRAHRATCKSSSPSAREPPSHERGALRAHSLSAVCESWRRSMTSTSSWRIVYSQLSIASTRMVDEKIDRQNFLVHHEMRILGNQDPKSNIKLAPQSGNVFESPDIPKFRSRFWCY